MSPKKVLKIFKYQHFVVQTSSMSPSLNPGDLIFIKELDLDKLQKNEIITFYVDFNRDGKKNVVTHYFDSIEIIDGVSYFRTKREGTENLDSWKIPEEDLIGKYVNHIPKIGRFVLFLQSPFGIGVIIVDLALLFLIIYFTTEDTMKKIEENIEKKEQEEYQKEVEKI